MRDRDSFFELQEVCQRPSRVVRLFQLSVRRGQEAVCRAPSSEMATRFLAEFHGLCIATSEQGCGRRTGKRSINRRVRRTESDRGPEIVYRLILIACKSQRLPGVMQYY